jgi:hypothetical protein
VLDQFGVGTLEWLGERDPARGKLACGTDIGWIGDDFEFVSSSTRRVLDAWNPENIFAPKMNRGLLCSADFGSFRLSYI